MVVSDDDIGENAQFSLSLQFGDIRFMDSFSVEPTRVTGRSPVIIRVTDNSALDYESGVREIQLYVIASVLGEEVNYMSMEMGGGCWGNFCGMRFYVIICVK